MTMLKTTLAATTATLLVLGGAAFADGHALDLGAARLDTSLDVNGDGTVSDEEIIDGNVAIFDANGDGALDASERSLAEEMVMSGSTAEGAMSADAGGATMQMNFDAGAARLDLSLDTNGDGEVDDDEIIKGNMDVFDTDNSGAINAAERGVAEQLLRTGTATISIDGSMAPAEEMSGAAIDFNVSAARLDTSLDTNGDGEVDDNEIIDGNMEIFDTNNSGAIDAAERSMAEEMLMNN